MSTYLLCLMLCVSYAIGVVGQEKGVVSSPESAWENFQNAAASEDFETISRNLTKSSICLLLGQRVFELERHVRAGTDEENRHVDKLRVDFGVSELDTWGNLQVLSSRRQDVSAAFVASGAAVNDPVKFYKATSELMAKWRLAQLEAMKQSLEGHLKKLRESANKDDSTIKEETGKLEEKLKQVDDELKAEKKPKGERKWRSLQKVSEVKINGDKATGFVEIEGAKQPVLFEKEGGVWKVALCESTEHSKGPTDAERTMIRLSNRGKFDFDFEAADFPPSGRLENPTANRFEYDGSSHLAAELEDADLKSLSSIQDLRSLSIIRAKRVTAAGIANLSKLPDLRKLHLAGIELGSDAVNAISKIKTLKTVRLEGVRASKETFAKLKEALPRCDVVVRYLLRPMRLEGDATVEKLRDKKRVTLLMLVGYGMGPFHERPTSDSLEEQESTLKRLLKSDEEDERETAKREIAKMMEEQELYQFIVEQNIQVLEEFPAHAAEDKEYWKANPHYEPFASPQVLIYAPDENKPMKVAPESEGGFDRDEVHIKSYQYSPVEVLKALKAALKKG